jgi:DNA-directed RNA polymerase subunit M/transcription elongation factor TFIIS
MKFCEADGRVMKAHTDTGVVVFRCSCGAERAGEPEDARIAGELLTAGEVTEMYGPLIRNAPFDRTNQLVKRDCPECGRDYMSQIRVGEAEVIVYKCKCGATAQIG